MSLLEALRSIPDRRRAEGKRFDLASVLLYTILGMVAGANSYRQMHGFIRVHRQRLNEAFGLALRYAPSYTGLRDILQGVDPKALEAAFRAHASAITSTAPPREGLVAVAVDGKTLRGGFDAFADKKAAAHALGFAPGRPDRPGPQDGRGEERRDPDGSGTDRGAQGEGLHIHARRRTRAKQRLSG